MFYIILDGWRCDGARGEKSGTSKIAILTGRRLLLSFGRCSFDSKLGREHQNDQQESVVQVLGSGSG